jgi:hypothetical protein
VDRISVDWPGRMIEPCVFSRGQWIPMDDSFQNSLGSVVLWHWMYPRIVGLIAAGTCMYFQLVFLLNRSALTLFRASRSVYLGITT